MLFQKQLLASMLTQVAPFQRTYKYPVLAAQFDPEIEGADLMGTCLGRVASIEVDDWPCGTLTVFCFFDLVLA